MHKWLKLFTRVHYLLSVQTFPLALYSYIYLLSLLVFMTNSKLGHK